MTDVIGKQIPLTIDTVAAARPQVEGGKVKVLGVTSRKPTELLPGAPTIASQGVDGFEVIAWNALYARSEEHTSELQSLMRISYAVFCLKKKKEQQTK